MKKVLKTSFYVAASMLLTGLHTVTNAIDTGANRVDQDIVVQWTADQVIQTWLQNLLTFLYLVAVILGIWWGFNILTASWDEDKVKKGKTIILQALAWVVIIFLAWSIVEWLIKIILA